MKKYGLKKDKCQGHEEDNDEDIQHALLCILGTDLDDFFAVLDGSLFFIEVDVLLDEDDGTVGTCDNRLCCCTAEPVDYCASHEETEDDLGLDKAQFGNDGSFSTCFRGA